MCLACVCVVICSLLQLQFTQSLNHWSTGGTGLKWETETCCFTFDLQYQVCYLLETSLLLVSFVSGGFKRLHAAPHVPLKHLPILTLFLPQRHKVTAVVRLILDTSTTRQQPKTIHKNTTCTITQQHNTREQHTANKNTSTHRAQISLIRHFNEV